MRDSTNLPPDAILVIDSDATMRLFLRRVLEARGFDPVCFGSVGEAVKAPPRRYSAIVLDVMWLDAQATEDLEDIHKAWAGIPLLVLVDTPDRIKTLGLQQYGALAIAKPFKNEELTALVRRLADEGRQLGVNTPRPCKPPRPILW
ncbi:MAG TPA: hypothetical protein VI643_07745 [Planctomycetota bacterium]|nr:hypothetical protein [Planctomycetota bacterium]